MQKVKFIRSGVRIKEERLRLGIKSQAIAATRFGVERETWSRYETGKLEMGREVFQRFIEAGADPDYITTGFRREEFEASIKKADKNPLVSDDDSMAGMFAALTPKSRTIVLSMTRRLRELEMMEDMLREEVLRRGGIIRDAAEQMLK